ncbi:outer membrane protein assembly factor BamE domain-containing protein [Microbulbifer epialgicus]|uniref:Outer membrane protein assembly factor BamE n=1 Tax=Microbulbifer epialgicus TaxID=393907 RepID=A0ABV4NUB3_9GAMM
MKILVFLCTALLMTACANVQQGTQFTADDINSFQQGVTTSDQVRTKLGSPNSVTKGNFGEEIWTYYYSEAKSNGAEWIPVAGSFLTKTESVSRNAQLIFSPGGVLKTVTYSESNGGSDKELFIPPPKQAITKESVSNKDS